VQFTSLHDNNLLICISSHDASADLLTYVAVTATSKCSLVVTLIHTSATPNSAQISFC
jgi:hypothetical protein